MPDLARGTGSVGGRARAIGWGISFALHAMVLLTLMLALGPRMENSGILVSARFGSSESSPGSSGDGVHVVTSTEDVTGDLVEAQVQSLVARQEGLDVDQQLGRLDRASAHLERISSAESLDEMADRFHGWLGLSPRAAQPDATATGGAFDLDTAQVHDITRHVDEHGTVTFRLVLLDAQGRTTALELSEEEGRTVYKLMQRLKANPLLEKLYRRIAMPLLDRLVHGRGSDADNAEDGGEM